MSKIHDTHYSTPTTGIGKSLPTHLSSIQSSLQHKYPYSPCSRSCNTVVSLWYVEPTRRSPRISRTRRKETEESDVLPPGTAAGANDEANPTYNVYKFTGRGALIECNTLETVFIGDKNLTAYVFNKPGFSDVYFGSVATTTILNIKILAGTNRI